MFRSTVVTVVLSLTVAIAAQSQRPNTRTGFWIGFGFGDGSVGSDCTSCGNDRTSGFSGHLRLGGTLSRSVLLGGETNGWFHSSGGVDENLGFATFVAMFYPSARGAFYIKVGVGGMTYTADDGFDRITATAPAGSVGVGYEFRMGSNVSLAPFLNVLGTSAASFKINGLTATSDEEITVNMVQFGLGIVWH
jgi:hypothetical protein